MSDSFEDLLLQTIILLRKSEDSDWSSMSVNEATRIIEEQHTNVQYGMEVNFLELRIAFAPTSYLQEISTENGWDSEYLNIAAKIDKFIP